MEKQEQLLLDKANSGAFRSFLFFSFLFFTSLVFVWTVFDSLTQRAQVLSEKNDPWPSEKFSTQTNSLVAT